MDILDQIIDTEEAAPASLKNEQLAEVSTLAQRQLDIMGFDQDGNYITAIPGGESVTKFLDWARKLKVHASPEALTQFTISELCAALIHRVVEFNGICTRALPDAMASLEMSEFKLASGFKVLVKDEVIASIRKYHEEKAVEFLASIGCGDVAKEAVSITLGKDERELAKRFLDLAKELDVIASSKLSVHGSTLKSLVKEQLALGVEFPESEFSVHQYKKTEIKPASKK